MTLSKLVYVVIAQGIGCYNVLGVYTDEADARYVQNMERTNENSKFTKIEYKAMTLNNIDISRFRGLPK